MTDPSGADAFLETVSAFAAREVEPVAAEIDRDARMPDGLVDALGALDLFTLGAPLEIGGCGASVPVTLGCLAAIGTASASVGLLLGGAHAAAAAVAAGAPESARVVVGHPAAILDSGSIVASSSAAPALLSGPAPRVEHATAAEKLLVVAQADGAEHLFAVPVSATGIFIRQALATTGLRGSDARAVSLEAAPADVRVGGTRQIDALRRWQSLGMGAVAVGLARRALAEAAAYAAERRQFGRPVADFPAVRTILDGCADLVAAAEGQLALAGQAEERGTATVAQSVRAARRAARTAVAVCLDALQIHGGYGYVSGCPIERLLRDAVSLRAVTSHVYVRAGSVESRHLTIGLVPDLTR